MFCDINLSSAAADESFIRFILIFLHGAVLFYVELGKCVGYFSFKDIFHLKMYF